MENLEKYNLIHNEIFEKTQFKFILKDGTEIYGKGHVGSVTNADTSTKILIKKDEGTQKVTLGEISEVEIIDDYSNSKDE